MTATDTPAPTTPPLLRRARFEDYPQIFRLESVFFEDSLPPSDRRGLFEHNPLWPRLHETWPIGWVLEDADGHIVGSVNNIPSSYLFESQELICGNGHCWAVLKPYRSYAAMLMDEYFNQDDPNLIVSAKVGVDATQIWSAYAERIPVGDWATAAVAITHYRSFARAALDRKGVPFGRVLAPPLATALRVRDALTPKTLPDVPTSFEFRELDGFDAQFDAFWRELVEQNPKKLLGVRDAATLRWHYSVPLRTKRLWIGTAMRNGLMRAYCVLKQHTRPGGARSMKLVDFQTVEHDVDLLPGLVKLALRRSVAESCSFLEHHGCGLPKWRCFETVAAYRIAKPSWSFYYIADDPALGMRLADPNVWDPSEFDGDSSYK